MSEKFLNAERAGELWEAVKNYVDGKGGDTTFIVNAPIGAIILWSGPEDTIPPGWHICDGTNGTEDLRGRFALGVSEEHPLGETGGSEEVTLTVAQMPKHVHNYTTYQTSTKTTTSTSSSAVSFANNNTQTNGTYETGSSQPHPNMPPYLALYYIQKIAATPTDYVTREGVEEMIAEGGGASSGVPTGSVTSYLGTTAPDGWILVDGSILQIADYPNLADFIEQQFGSKNKFGGDGVTTFAVPNLSGKFVLGNSTNHAIGETGGSEEVTLTVEQMPEHSHKYYERPAMNAYIETKTSGSTRFITSQQSDTTSSGSNLPHENMPPYYVLTYIMKT